MMSSVKLWVTQEIRCSYCRAFIVLSDKARVDVGERVAAMQLPENWRMVVQHPQDGMVTHVVCPRHQIVVRDWSESRTHYVERDSFPGGYNNLREVGLDAERPSLADGGTEAKPAWTRRADPEDPFDFA